MSDSDEGKSGQISGADGESTGHSLAAAASHVARSPGTSCPGCVGCKAFSLAFGALLEWAITQELIRAESDFILLSRDPDAAGNEHEVWFDESTNRWFKATYPNRFGLPWGREEHTATAREYLTRLVLQNEFFSDDIHLVALINDGGQMRVLTSQPHIAGEAAPVEEIQHWFRLLGFVRLESDGCVAWYRKRENLLVADAHEGNVIKTQQGALVPIDLNIVQPEGEMRAWAENIFDSADP